MTYNLSRLKKIKLTNIIDFLDPEVNVLIYFLNELYI